MSEASAPDIKQLRDRDLPQGKFPGDAKSAFRVFIHPKAHDEVHKHARENTDVEICGVLVGQWGRDDRGPFLSVSNSIRGESATNKLAEVTFTHALPNAPLVPNCAPSLAMRSAMSAPVYCFDPSERMFAVRTAIPLFAAGSRTAPAST